MKNILCFGDSNTWGYDFTTYDPLLGSGRRLPYGQRWPDILRADLKDHARVMEDALNARTLLQEDPYFPHRRGLDALEMALDAYAPLDLVILHLGVNELKHIFNLSAKMIAFGMEILVTAAQTSYYGYPAPKVLLIAPPPVRSDIYQMVFGFSYGPDAYAKSCQLGEAYAEVARRKNCAFLDCGSMSFELNDVDGLHYSANDHLRLGKAVSQTVRELLDLPPLGP